MSGAGWSGYAKRERVTDLKWRLTQPLDDAGEVIVVEITFPEGWDDDRRQAVVMRMLSGIVNG